MFDDRYKFLQLDRRDLHKAFTPRMQICVPPHAETLDTQSPPRVRQQRTHLTFERSTCAISAERCPTPKTIHILPHRTRISAKGRISWASSGPAHRLNRRLERCRSCSCVGQFCTCLHLYLNTCISTLHLHLYHTCISTPLSK